MNMNNYYDENTARALVIKAGHELIEKKLIARTWGNISARISKTQFIITPSGRSYEDLKEDELVKVNISDCTYEGDIKPSSEKRLHANAYALRDDAAFVIHTHQFYASAVCAECKSVPFAPCAKYGLSGTKALSGNVAKVIEANPSMKSFLMARHGAVLIGGTYEEAFALASELEDNCKELFDKKAKSKGHASWPWLDDYAQMFSLKGIPMKGEDEEAIELVKAKNEAASRYVRFALPIPATIAKLEHLVYVQKYSKLKG